MSWFLKFLKFYRSKQENKLKAVVKKVNEDDEDVGEKIIGKENIETGSVR